MTLTDTQKQLLILAIDKAAAEGERNNAAVAFFRLVRKDFADGYEFLTKLTGKTEDARSVYGAVIMKFGKHKGQRLDQTPIDYLLWLLDNCDTLNRATVKPSSAICRIANMPTNTLKLKGSYNGSLQKK
jgi:hypothetical protein